MESIVAPPGDALLRIVVADPDALARRLIVAVLRNAGLSVVAEPTTAGETFEATGRHRPDVLVLGLVMPDGDGLDVLRKLRDVGDEVAVVVFTSRSDDETGLAAFAAGAQGFLGKECGVDPLPRAIRAVAAGEAVIPRRLGTALLARLRSSDHDHRFAGPGGNGLTVREREVLELLCARRSTGEIADALVLSSETVRSHVKRILRKLDARTRAEAVAKAGGLGSVW